MAGNDTSLKAGSRSPGTWTSLRWPGAILAALVAAIALTSLGTFYVYQRSIKHEVHTQLAVIADLKVRRLIGWMTERHADAYALSHNLLLGNEVARIIRAPAPEVERRVESYLAELLTAYPYEAIVLFDPEGDPRMEIGPGAALRPEDRESAAEVARTGHIVRSNFHAAAALNGGPVEIDFYAPLFALEDGTLKVAAVAMLRISSVVFVHPLILEWPAPSVSGESFLVQREGDYVVFVTELRHRKDAPLKLRLPATDTFLPAATAVRGFAGEAEGVDYRGVPVVAAVRRVGEYPWYLEAKIDTAEAYAPIRPFALATTLIALLATAGAGAVVASYWRAQRAQQAKNELQQALERQALEKHFEYLTRYANDVIVLADEGGNVVEVNDRALEVSGYSREEVVKIKLLDVIVPELQREFLGQLRGLKTGGVMFETVHRRKDGSTVPVEVSARMIEVEGRRFLQGIVRDISERKSQFERLERLLAQTVEAMAVTVEKRDPFTAGHQKRVAELAVAVARELGLPRQQADGIRFGALIHDIGKISIPAEILDRPGRLHPFEMSLVRTHSDVGYDIVKDIDFPWPVAQMIRHHHERLDGSGYPAGLQGEAIPLEARILAVADVVEAMCSHRPYRPALGVDAALEEISGNRGRRYDSEVVDACVRLFRDKGFAFSR